MKPAHKLANCEADSLDNLEAKSSANCKDNRFDNDEARSLANRKVLAICETDSLINYKDWQVCYSWG